MIIIKRKRSLSLKENWLAIYFFLINRLENSMKERIRVIAQNKFAFPAFLLFISILSYGLLSPWIKFFHDEYSILWFHHRAQDVSLFFEGNRPFLAYIYTPFLNLFGTNSYLWSLFGALSRWLHALCIFWFVREIWPDDQPFAVFTSLLCIVYPAFQAQFASMIFGILFLLFSIFLLSLLFTIKALKGDKNQTLLIIISLLLSFINLISSEYFFSLEVLRYVIIFLYLNKDKNRVSFKEFLHRSLVYLILFFSMIGWRFYQQASETTYKLDFTLQTSIISIPKVTNFVKKILVDVWNVSIGAWIYALYPRHLIEVQSTMVLIITLVLFLLIASLCFLYFRNLNSFKYKTEKNNPSAIIFALIALFAAGVPFWIAKLPIGEYYAFSRWTIPFMVGVSILIAKLILLVKKHTITIFLSSFLIALGAGNQVLVANSFRQDWNKQMSYIWQFKWRIPSLQENTAVFSNMLDFDYENSDEISMALNLQYPSVEKLKIPLFQFYLPERVGTVLLPTIEPGLSLAGRRYYGLFQGNSSQSIIVDFQYPFCFKVLDPEIDIYNPNIDSLSKDALFLSNTALISKNGKQINQKQVENIFGKVPHPDWCYYFEKADLARQFNDWYELKEISTIVIDRELFPRDNREWFPFIEGYAHNNDWDSAVALSRTISSQSPQYVQMLQALWNRIDRQIEPSLEKELAKNNIEHMENECEY